MLTRLFPNVQHLNLLNNDLTADGVALLPTNLKKLDVRHRIQKESTQEFVDALSQQTCLEALGVDRIDGLVMFPTEAVVVTSQPDFELLM